MSIIWKKRFQIRLHPNTPALILRICLNASYDSLRKLDRMQRQTDLSPLENAPAPPEHGADRDLEEREIVEQVQRAIHRLPRKRALAVMMRLIQEESFAAIAQALDCSETTSRIHISRRRAQLRKWLSPLWEGRHDVEIIVDAKTYLPKYIKKYSHDSGRMNEARDCILEARFLWNKPISTEIFSPQTPAIAQSANP